MVLIFAFLIVLMYMQKGLFSKILNLSCFQNIARYVYATYIMQRVAINIMNDIYKHFNIVQDNIYTYITTILACIVLGVITYHLIEKPAVRLLKNFNPLKFDIVDTREEVKEKVV